MANQNPTTPGPLAGLTVVELTHIMAGPTCGLMLADMGADVIKVERLPGGDDTRRTVPPEIDGESAAFMMMNRNKRGIAINLRTAGGKTVLHRLIRSADIFVENLRTGALDAQGFGYATVKQDNPGLIYCSLTGFGRTGPYADRGGFDLIAQGMGGIMHVTGEPDGPPTSVGLPICDLGTGMWAVQGILAALYERWHTGQGRLVECSLLETAIGFSSWTSAQ
jgi:crotonobetainyl-CoA:carnitine CoA-transferase CaiB-like acyl-CoA transferase